MFSTTNPTKDYANDIKNPAQRLKGEAISTFEDTKDDLRDVANKAGRRLRGFINEAGDEIYGVSDKVTTQIRRSPIQASLIALGAGFLLGAMFRK